VELFPLQKQAVLPEIANQQPNLQALVSNPLLPHLLPVGFGLLLALIGSWPLALHWRDHIPGPPWDGFVWLYDLWWLRESLFVRGLSPFWQRDIFVPFGGYNVWLSDVNLSNKALVLPVLLGTSHIIAYNFLVWLSLMLSSTGAWLLARRLTGSHWAGLVAAIVFAWSPYRLTSMATGLPPVFATQWLPFALLALEWLLDPTRQQNWRRDGFLFGLFSALQALTSWYNAYTLALALPVWFLARLCWRWHRRRDTTRQWFRALLADSRGLLLGALVAACLVLPPFLALLRASQGAQANWTFFTIELWQASLDDFLRPSIFHPLWGSASLTARDGILPDYPWNAPGVLYLGWVPLALALLALWSGRGAWRWAALTVLLLAGLLALGPTLHWNGQRLYLPVGEPVQQAVVSIIKALEARAPNKLTIPQAFFYAYPGEIFLPLPPLLGYLFVGMLKGLRWWLRFSLATTLMAALLGGAGLALLARPHPQRRARAVAWPALLLLALLVEFWPAPLAYGLGYAGPGALEQQLRALPSGTLIEFPLVRSTAGPGMYRQVWHRHPLAGGAVTYYPPAWQAGEAQLADFPSPQSVALLRQWDVRWIVVSPTLYDTGWADQPGDTWQVVQSRLAATPGLRLVAEVTESPSRLGDRISPQLRQRRAPLDPDRVLIFELLKVDQ
jgi:hypothetical protein